VPDRILSIEGMQYSYSSREGSFTVSLPVLHLLPGDFVGLVGNSGSGKSTILDILGLVRKPAQVARFELSGSSNPAVSDVNRYWLDGDDAGLSRVRAQSLGYVLQSGGLLPFLCVGENIELPRRIAGLPVSRTETLTAMESLGLDWGYDKRVQELSGGERQRVAILRAISHRPKVILADEPTAAVDSRRAREVVGILRDMSLLHESAVVMVSHDRELTSSVANRMLTLELQQASDGNTHFSAVPSTE